jgi:adenosylhomocysteinase
MTTTVTVPSDVTDLSLAGLGKRRIEWADQLMPVLALIRKRFSEEKPLAGLRIAGCLHVTSETANLARTLQAGGAEVYLCASNPLSTQDEVAASLVEDYGVSVFARKGEDNATYYGHLKAVLDVAPHVTMDDGADLVSMLHKDRTELIAGLLGSTEETTTGVIRLKAMSRDGALRIPVIAVNESDTKHLFDNRYGTGQSTLDGIVRATNVLFAGLTVVVVGYGWCGRGVASRADGLGANVVVVEVNPVRALGRTWTATG